MHPLHFLKMPKQGFRHFRQAASNSQSVHEITLAGDMPDPLSNVSLDHFQLGLAFCHPVTITEKPFAAQIARLLELL